MAFDAKREGKEMAWTIKNFAERGRSGKVVHGDESDYTNTIKAYFDGLLDEIFESEDKFLRKIYDFILDHIRAGVYDLVEISKGIEGMSKSNKVYKGDSVIRNFVDVLVTGLRRL